MNKKNIISLVCTIAMVGLIIFAVKPASSSNSSGTSSKPTSYVDGTYEGEGDGFGGKVTVKITVEGGKITAAELTGDSETPTIGGAALEELQEQIIAANGADIDGVSGASLTSNGTRAAVEDALS